MLAEFPDPEHRETLSTAERTRLTSWNPARDSWRARGQHEDQDQERRDVRERGQPRRTARPRSVRRAWDNPWGRDAAWDRAREADSVLILC